MKDDILESVSQRGRGEETPENRRIYEIADELRRGCQLYEAQLRDGQNHVNYSPVLSVLMIALFTLSKPCHFIAHILMGTEKLVQLQPQIVLNARNLWYK